MQEYIIKNPDFDNFYQFREKLIEGFGSSYFTLKNWDKEKKEDDLLRAKERHDKKR